MIIPSGFAQINFKLTGASCPLGAEVTMGANISSYGGSVAQAATDAAVVWNDTIRTVLPASVVLGSVLVKFGPNSTGPSAEVASGAAGSGGGTSASPQVAWLVRKNTALGGRAGRGRFYVPGVQESEVDPGGNLTPAFVTGAQTVVDQFVDDLGTALLIPTLLHGAGSPITTPTTITTCSVDTVAATQRRRQRH